ADERDPDRAGPDPPRRARAPWLAARSGAAAVIPRAGLLLALAACTGPSTENLRDWSNRIESLPPPAVIAGHSGPGVAPGATGTGRFARVVYEAFRADRAMETVTFADGYYREPGNEGFEAVLEHVRAGLSEAGFWKEDWL